MSEISEPSSPGSPSGDAAVKPDDRVIRRILVIMTILTLTSVIVSLFVFGPRETIGLVIGGLLSFLNFYWLKASLRQMLGQAAAGKAEPTSLWLLRYNLRFLSLILVIMAVYLTGFASIAALLAGLLSLAGAILIEGFIQLFLAVFKRGN